LEEALHALGDEARATVGGGDDVEVSHALDCRYRGQSHELTVESVEDFPEEHRRRNGYARPEAPVEVVALRARARRPAALEPVDLPAPERERVVGPAVAVEVDCTVWVAEGWIAEPGPAGAWVITRSKES
jgi:N-methylhydantoinase A/oxoprolinase/acetone carboxylase beta subunit